MTPGERDLLAGKERRFQGAAKVTGEAIYAADVRRPGMLHAAFATSPHAHARVIAVDAESARRMPGVRAVLTGADLAPARFGRRLQDWPVLAWERVRFIGDRVAAVAAETPEQAAAAVRAIGVTYEVLAPVLDPDAALADGAPLLHPERDAYRLIGPALLPRPHPNLQACMSHEHGEVDAAFAAASHVFEHSFSLARTIPGYLEPQASLVWLESERVHVLTTNKGPFVLRQQIAACTGVPEERIEVHTVAIGGDFGGKGLTLDECALYYLARAAGRPVRSVLRSVDDLQTAGTRRAARVRLRTALDAQGRIVGHDARIVYDGGAYAAGGAGPHLIPSDFATLAAYRVPASRIAVLGAYTNTLPGGSVRAPGQQQLMFAADSHLDAMARALGADPLDFREQNLAQPGEPNVLGVPWPGSSLPEVIRLLRKEVRWGAPPAAGRGRGVSVGLRRVGRGRAGVTVTLLATGDVEVVTGLPEHGTGIFTVMQRVAARELGLPPERVTVRLGSTAASVADDGHGGSRATPVHGGAVLDGARRLRAAIAERAPRLPWDAAAATLAPLTVAGTIDQQVLSWSAYAQCVEVSVDRETGAFTVEDAVIVADVGTVINPVAVRGQLEGGFLFGLGAALMEEVVIDDSGRVATTSLGDYKLPSIADVPPLRVVLYSGSPGPGPFGARSVGELANPGVAPVVANAVADATGVRLTSLPLTAERLHAALRERRVTGS